MANIVRIVGLIVIGLAVAAGPAFAAGGGGGSSAPPPDPNYTKAEERLDVLDDACFFGCEEYSKLKELIKDYKNRQGAS